MDVHPNRGRAEIEVKIDATFAITEPVVGVDLLDGPSQLVADRVLVWAFERVD